jgi:hypothetical protein
MQNKNETKTSLASQRQDKPPEYCILRRNKPKSKRRKEVERERRAYKIPG